MKRQITCIICPMGCEMEAVIEDGKLVSVTGNTCPRGAEYARTECTNPMRTLTTTVRCDNGAVVPVRTSNMIPKDKMAACMKIINAAVAHLPISAGDVIIEDVFGSQVVATGSLGGEIGEDHCGSHREGGV